MGIANITNNILTDSGAVIGAANGVATLDSGGKIPVSQLPNSVMEFKGTWSAATNTPTLANGTGNAGDVYEVTAAGTVNFGAGGIAFAVGDYVVYDGSTWQYSSGQKGTITSLTFSAPLTGGTITTSGTVGIPAATSTVNGYLSSTDWTTFNSKQAALSGTGFVKSTAGVISYDTNTYLTTSAAASTYVPYTGATGNVNLGFRELQAGYLYANGTSTDGGALNIKKYATVTVAGAGYFSLTAGDGVARLYDNIGGISKSANLSFASIADYASRTYTFPNASGTFALTSDLSGYLPLTGGTISGTLQVGGTFNQLYLGASKSSLYLDASRYVMSTISTYGIAFEIGVTPVMSIPTSGNVLINTTTDAGYKLDVNGTGRFSNQLLLGNFNGEALKFQSATSTGSTYLRFYNSAGTARGYLGLFWSGTADYMVLDAGATQMNFGSSNSFTFTGGGAATFSSSVTATNLYTSYTAAYSAEFYRNNAADSRINLTNTTTTSGADKGLMLGEIGVDSYFYNYATGAAIFGTSSTERMRITSSGNVGIGTTSPGAKLDIAGGDLYVRTGGALYANTLAPYSGNMTISLGGSGNNLIVSGGNVGIGTTTISTNSLIRELVIGQGITNGVSKLSFRSESNSLTSDISLSSYLGENLMAISTTSNIPMLFVTNSTERMRITSGGNVLIGTTSNSGQKLVVYSGNTLESSAHLHLSNPNFSGFHWLDGTAYWIGQNSDYRQLRMYSGSNIYTGVYIAAGGSSWSSYSDERMKTDLMPIENATEKVSQLRSMTGRYKTDSQDKKRSFLLAQDVLEVLPEAVNLDTNSGMYGVQYTDVIPLLVASIKELKAELDTLKNK